MFRKENGGDGELLWITIPTYNEADNIETLIGAVFSAVPDSRLIVVDDNSPDGTAEIVARIAKNDTRLHLIRREGKLGYASAVLTGLRHALAQGAEWLGHMDADFSHDPKVLPELVGALQAGADMTLGSRYVQGGSVEGWSLWRKVLSKTANMLVQTLLYLPVQDCTSGFRIYRREALQRLSLERLKVEGYGFLYLSTALAVWNGFHIAEVPIMFVDRRQGKSKLSRRIILEAAIALTKVFVWRHTGRWLGKPLIE